MKKITRFLILRHDQLYGTSLQRLLEMAVDGVVASDPIYSVQFWRDMSLYGMSEAGAYLRSAFPNADFSEFDKISAQIKEALVLDKSDSV